MHTSLLRGGNITKGFFLSTIFFFITAHAFSQTNTTSVECGQTITYPIDGCETAVCSNPITITGGGSQTFNSDGNYLCVNESDIGELNYNGTNNNQIRLCGNNRITGIGTNFGEYNSFVNTRGATFNLDYTGFGHTNHLTITNYGTLYLQGSDNYNATTIYNVGAEATIYTSGDFIVNGDDSIYLIGGTLNVNGKLGLNNASALFCLSNDAFINAIDVEVNSANEIHVSAGSRSCLRYTGTAVANSNITQDTMAVCMAAGATPIQSSQSWGPRVNVVENCSDCSTTISPLPVLLRSFEVKQTNNIPVLKWTTLQEINTSSFEIERSGTGAAFKKIASLQANGSSDADINYTYTDRQAGNGAIYYRLKMVDIDGAFTYSPIKMLQLNAANNSLRMIAASNNELQIGLPQVHDIGLVKLLDVQGRLLWQQQVHANLNRLSVPVPNIARGNYFVQYSDGRTQQTIQAFIPK